MNQFDIQMAILGPMVQAQIQEFNDKGIKTIEFESLDEGIPEEQLQAIYRRIQEGITKVGYRFSERAREEDIYFASAPGMKGYTLTRAPFALRPNEVVIDKTASLEARVGTTLHEFGHAASYPSGTNIPNSPFDFLIPYDGNHPQIYNEILADVSAYLVAEKLGLSNYRRRVVAYMGLHRIQPAWIESHREAIYKNASYMLAALGFTEAATELPAAA